MSTTSLGIGVAIVIGLLLIYNLFFILFYEKLLFQGESLAPNHVFEFAFEYEELVFTPEAEVSLHGLLLKANDPKGIIIYFHGNRGSVERWAIVGDNLRQHGYDVIVMDYRGYGKSSGPRSESGLYRDAAYVYDAILKAYDYQQVFVYGRSLGSAVATMLATNRSIDHLILETPMTKIREVIPALNFLLVYKPLLAYEFNSLGRIHQITCPITIIHGTSDAIVPYRMGLELYENIDHAEKKLITINGGKHNNLDTFEICQQAIGRILK